MLSTLLNVCKIGYIKRVSKKSVDFVDTLDLDEDYQLNVGREAFIYHVWSKLPVGHRLIITALYDEPDIERRAFRFGQRITWMKMTEKFVIQDLHKRLKSLCKPTKLPAES